MSFNQRCCNRTFKLLALSLILCNVAIAQDVSTLSLPDVLALAERRMGEGNYSQAIPALEEALSRVQDLTDPQGAKTAQTCRLELARMNYQLGQVSEGMKYVEEYLDNKPREQETAALRLLAQGFFEIQDWDKIIEISSRLKNLQGLTKDDLLTMNLLVGQAYFHKGEYDKCVEPLKYAERNTDDDRTQGVCQIMVARALVEMKDWEQLYPWVLKIDRTERRYDIVLNLTLMKAGMALFDSGEYLNALYMYRMVMPREMLLDHANQKLATMNKQVAAGVLPDAEISQLKAEIDALNKAIEQLKNLPPYEEEVSFRVGQIYADVKRYWEGFVAFDRLSSKYADSTDENVQTIVDASELQAVIALYNLKQIDRAEARAIAYLDKKPDGPQTRTMLSLLMRNRLTREEFDKVVELQPYLDRISESDDLSQRRTQADLNYMMGFGYLQTGDYKAAADQFGLVLDLCRGSSSSESDVFGVDPEGALAPSALYYRGMSYLLQADYTAALADFRDYEENYKNAAQYPDAVFRDAVCLFGLENVPESEAGFSQFIESFPSNALVSEAYSMRGDIEASKEATNEDPLTLERAQADYRKAIDSATTALQASYPAFQAAKVYKMESKWQEIIDLMNYYLLRWEDSADIAEAIFWTGQAQIELGQLQEEAIPAYINAIMRYGNDVKRPGVDKIILELVSITKQKLSPEDRDALAIRLKLKLASVGDDKPVLRLRLEFAQAMLEGDDVAMALAAKRMDSIEDLTITTPLSLSMMCDVAVDTGNVEQMRRLSDYFISTFEDSDLLWHGYRARVFALLEEKDYQDVLLAIDEAQNGPFDLDDMGWAQITKANTLYQMGQYKEAEEEYNRLMGVPQWRGPLMAEATLGIGKSRMAAGDLEGAHVFFQRTYLLFGAYDNGKWAAEGYLDAADCLVKQGRKADAIKTLQAMLDDKYTKDHAPDEVRALLKNYEGQ